MKEWLTMLLAALTLLTGSAFAETTADVEPQMSVTFEMFCADVGVPYNGEWVCFDDAVYLYLPSALDQRWITEQMRADGVLATYIGVADQDNIMRVWVEKREHIDSIQTIIKEFQKFCINVIYLEVNELPVVTGYAGNEFYAEVLTDAGAAYRMRMSFSCDIEDVSTAQGMYIYGMLYSISETALEITGKSADIDAYGREQEKAPVRLSSEIRIRFDFNDRDPEDLDLLNTMLAAMQLTEVEVEDIDGYLASRKKIEHGEVVDITYLYGLDSGILVCKKADSGQRFRYQIAIETFDSADAMDNGKFAQYWKAAYPERSLSTVVIDEFEPQTAFVAIYYEPIAE